jgi:hypothetical protein
VTTVEILLSEDTVDESVSGRLKAKIQRMSEVLDDNSINVEAVGEDLEQDDALDADDVTAFLDHLNRR